MFKSSPLDPEANQVNISATLPPRATPLAAAALLAFGLASAQQSPFEVSSIGPAGSVPEDLALTDLDGDGLLDLAIANRTGNSVRVLLGTGTGDFQLLGTYAVGSQPVAIGAADLDADGRPDLFTADAGSARVSVLFGAAGGGFEAAQSHVVGFSPTDVVSGDFDANGALDLAVASDDIFQPITLLMGDGNRGFLANALPLQGWCASALASADLDGDGLPELVVGSLLDDRVVVLRGAGSGYTSGGIDHYSVGLEPRSIVLADLDGDGLLDTLSADSGSDQISVLRGRPGGMFDVHGVHPVGAGPVALAVDDFDGDERLDALVANLLSNDMSLLRGDGVGGFEDAESISAGMFPSGVAAGDINSDFHADAVVTNSFFNSATALVSNAGPWINLGLASPGLRGGSILRLMGSGETTPGSMVSINVAGGLRRFAGHGLLVVGFERLDAPFKGGVLVPQPTAVAQIALSVPLALRWPNFLSAGTNVYWQAWFPAHGFVSSNALRTVHQDG